MAGFGVGRGRRLPWVTVLVLAIDTATPTLVVGVAVLDDDGLRVLVDRHVPTARGHAELLSSLVLDCLTEAGVARADLRAVVVGTGPGPFTGLRVGMASAVAFADALGIDVVGVCSLDAVVHGVPDAAHGDALVVTDARRREVYWARYVDTVRTDGPSVNAPSDIADRIDSPTTVLGSPDHAALLGLTARPDSAAPTVAGLVAAAAQQLRSGQHDPVVPLYLRRPDAVERARP
ncbi:tRNA (adenosine(37)-N6)-threonylcarbamoyltransferase complex dimerization subunit type 1 TsaB [Williamsia deligens]|uniref:tRNA (Adenosine(37)-N6)-threonylcarbamoyltransferase complex dimerization subunit type 1 TsaB n=1 Tax=Williamsia deligens TaxID=321325 RepID=A0ABW3G9U3_9NOCA|nr:tRNA threonylcarbamoyl adenosine modification protein YeaZ [Williamsia deligens]